MKRLPLIPVLLFVLIANNGEAQFGPGVLITDQVLSNDVRTADLDDDGDQDIVAHQQDGIVWLENLGLGSFGAPDTIGWSSPMTQFDFADVDGDGDLDLVSMLLGSDLVWSANTGAGQFNFPQIIANVGQWGNASGLICAELTGDSLPEIVFDTSGAVRWFSNGGGGVFSQQDSLPHGGPGSPVLLAGDLDLDGTNDLLHIDWNGNVTAYRNTSGTGTAWTTTTVLTVFWYYSGGMQLVDMDADGDLDLVDAKSQVKWSSNQRIEDGAFGVFGAQNVIQGTSPQEVGWAGQLGCGTGASIIWQTPPWTDPVQWSTYDQGLGACSMPADLMNPFKAGTIHAADLDSDGALDMILSEADSARIWWFPNLLPQQLLDSVSLTPFDTLCVYGAPYPLEHATPAGGTWTGAGVVANTYTPSLGTFDLTYTVTDTATGCPMSATQPITAFAEPEIIVVSGDPLAECEVSPLQLAAPVSTAVWTGLADSTGLVDRSCDVRPLIGAASYIFDAVNGSCWGEEVFMTLPGCLNLNLGPDQILCDNADTLVISVQGPVLGFTGVDGPFDHTEFVPPNSSYGYFYPGHQPGIYTFSATVGGANDCPAIDSVTVTVVAAPDPHILSTSLQFCEGDSSGDILADMPGDYGGVASGTNTALGIVQLSQLAPGSHPYSFTVTDTNSCVTVVSDSIELVEVPVATLTLPFGEFFPICSTAVALTGGIPLGGQYSITDDGLSDPAIEFDPQLYGIDTVLVTYTVSVPGTPLRVIPL
ncbi:MAG: VCBS repeat-containing protein [Flavobacteriales bacterium]|nr:VCBS repeat-containing protein [Flavobacteriales bacterium]